MFPIVIFWNATLCATLVWYAFYSYVYFTASSSASIWYQKYVREDKPNDKSMLIVLIIIGLNENYVYSSSNDWNCRNENGNLFSLQEWLGILQPFRIRCTRKFTKRIVVSQLEVKQHQKQHQARQWKQHLYHRRDHQHHHHPMMKLAKTKTPVKMMHFT